MTTFPWLRPFTVWWGRERTGAAVLKLFYANEDEIGQAMWVRQHPEAIRILRPPSSMVELLILDRWYALDAVPTSGQG